MRHATAAILLVLMLWMTTAPTAPAREIPIICEEFDMELDIGKAAELLDQVKRLEKTIGYANWLLSWMYWTAQKYEQLKSMDLEDLARITLANIDTGNTSPYGAKWFGYMDGKLAAIDAMTSNLDEFLATYNSMYPQSYDENDPLLDPQKWFDGLKLIRDARSPEDVDRAKAASDRMALQKAALVRALAESASLAKNRVDNHAPGGPFAIGKAEMGNGSNSEQATLDLVRAQWRNIHLTVDGQTRTLEAIMEMKGIADADSQNGDSGSYSSIPKELARIKADTDAELGGTGSLTIW